MIKPTIGRVVLFCPSDKQVIPEFIWFKNQPCTALVTYVWGDRMVNLVVFDHSGAQHKFTSMPLVQEGDPVSDEYHYCKWMPYQIGQAKKEETK